MIPFLVMGRVFPQPGPEDNSRVRRLSEAGDGAGSLLVCCGAQ